MINFRLKKNILVDLDQTLVQDREQPQIASRYLLSNILFDILIAEASLQGVDAKETKSKIEQHAKQKVFWDYPEFIEILNLDPDPVLAAWQKWHETGLEPIEPNVRWVKQRIRDHHAVHVCSNNPHQGCIMKVNACGIDENEIGEVFGANRGCGQKHDAEFWKRSLSSVGIEAGDVTMIGDNRFEDYEVPSEAGIRSFILLDPSFESPREIENGVITPDLSHIKTT
jgi:FMN phosphatase YigB (HAD superfamily)